MLELEGETAAATTNFHSGSTVYSWCMILVTQHAPFSWKALVMYYILIIHVNYSLFIIHIPLSNVEMTFDSLLRWKLIELYQFSLNHSYICSWMVRRIYIVSLGVKGLTTWIMFTLTTRGRLSADILSAECRPTVSAEYRPTVSADVPVNSRPTRLSV